jgi:hypothetical protein
MAEGRARRTRSETAKRRTRRNAYSSEAVLDIVLPADSELRAAIRASVENVVGVCLKHDTLPESVRLALEIAESALTRAVMDLNSAEHPDPAIGLLDEQARKASEIERNEQLRESLRVLTGQNDHVGWKQAFVLQAINYAATQVPSHRPKLRRELVLYALWRVGAAPFEILTDALEHDGVEKVIGDWEKAGGRGRARWEPAQQFLATFGIAAASPSALKETAERYGTEYTPPVFKEGCHEVILSEFDLISGRFSGCPCCHPEQFAQFTSVEK